MPDELDRKIADDVAFSAIGRLRPVRGGKVVSSRAALRAVILDAIQEAYEIGVLAAEKRQFWGTGLQTAFDLLLDAHPHLVEGHVRITESTL